VEHDAVTLSQFPSIAAQFELRASEVEKAVEKHGSDLNTLDAVVGMRPCLKSLSMHAMVSMHQT